MCYQPQSCTLAGQGATALAQQHYKDPPQKCDVAFPFQGLALLGAYCMPALWGEEEAVGNPHIPCSPWGKLTASSGC